MPINRDRFQQLFQTFSEFGTTTGNGVTRTTLSSAHFAARTWLKKRGEEAGLLVSYDGARNLSLFLPAATSNQKRIIIASHSDSVPNGGRFDGALGLIAGLEILLTLKESKTPPPYGVELVDFTDEEGAFIDFMGSRAVVGDLPLAEIESALSRHPALHELFQQCGITPASITQAKRNLADVLAYFELHIEQGPVLENARLPIGIVSGIVGIAVFHVTILGQANHSGTTPRATRKDAGLSACEFALEAGRLAQEIDPELTFNIGCMKFSPGASNVVPGMSEFTVEARSIHEEILLRLEKRLRELAETIAVKYKVSPQIERTSLVRPQMMDVKLREGLTRAAAKLGLNCMQMQSGAGHDAGIIAAVAPAGMVFVPSKNGISHSSEEFTEMRDCVSGVEVVFEARLKILNGL